MWHSRSHAWFKHVVERDQHDIMAYECAFIDDDAALILELAAHVDKDALANHGVLSAVGVERWKHPNTLRHLTSPKLLQQVM